MSSGKPVELCSRLPWWEGWLGPLLATVLVFSPFVVALERLCARALRKLSNGDSHWSLRAVVLFEAKLELFLGGVVAVALWATFVALWDSATGCSPTAPVALAGAAAIVALEFRALGALDARYRGSPRSARERARSVAVLLLTVQPGLIVTFAGILLGPFAPRDGWLWLWMLLMAALHVLAGTGLAYPLAAALGLAWPARESVRLAVERARADEPVAVRRVDELDWLMPNALAFPLTGVVAFSKCAADTLSDDELHAIALHELGHLAESRLVRWMRPAGGLLLLPYSMAIPLILAGHSRVLIGVFAGSLVLGLAALRWSQRHEKAADAHAAHHSATYARALETLHRHAGIPAALSKRSTHPSLYDRMLAAGVTPDFPRPAPPRLYRFKFLLLACIFAFGTTLTTALARRWWLRTDPDRDRAALIRVAFGGSPRDLVKLANRTRDMKLRWLLYRRAHEEDPEVLRKQRPR